MTLKALLRVIVGRAPWPTGEKAEDATAQPLDGTYVLLRMLLFRSSKDLETCSEYKCSEK